MIILNSYVMNNVGRNMNIISASDETFAKNKEHVIGLDTEGKVIFIRK